MYKARSKTRANAKRRPLFYVWAAYGSQEYGGPEEGGWFYDASEPLTGSDRWVVKCLSAKKASKAFRLMRKRMIELNAGKRPPWSARPARDWLVAEMSAKPPHSLPTVIPRYE